MTATDYATKVAELDGLLEDERQALLAGDLEVVQRLMPHKERLIDALGASGPSQNEDLLQYTPRLFAIRRFWAAPWRASGRLPTAWPNCGVCAKAFRHMTKPASEPTSI